MLIHIREPSSSIIGRVPDPDFRNFRVSFEAIRLINLSAIQLWVSHMNHKDSQSKSNTTCEYIIAKEHYEHSVPEVCYVNKAP
jgi:hypothetical protein